MSMPNIPNINPNITITADECYAMLLAAVALEEMGMAHIINAEGEKIQYVLGTLKGSTPPTAPTIDQVIAVNDSVASMLRNTIKNQIMLSYTLEDIMAMYNPA